MKKFAIIFFVFLFFTYAYGDNLASVSGTNNHTTSSATYIDVATTGALGMTNVSKVLVYATFTSASVTQTNITRIMTYQIHDNSGTPLTSNEISRYIRKDRSGDKGLGSLVYIFDVSGITSGDRTFSLAHKTATTKDVNTVATLVAIALSTDSDPYPTLDNDIKTITTPAVSTSSSTFSAVTGLITDAITFQSGVEGDLLLLASVNSRSNLSAAAGEWELQMKIGSGSYNSIGSAISRTLSGTEDTGIVNLVALVEDKTAEDYYFQVAHRATSGTVETLNSSLAAIGLGYAKSGDARYFPGHIATVASDDTELAAEDPAVTTSSITALGTSIALFSQFNMTSTGQSTSNYTLTASGGSSIGSIMQRYLIDAADVGSGSHVDLITGLTAISSYTFTLNHYLSATGTTLTSSNMILAAFQLTDFNDGPLPVTLSSFTAGLVNTTPQLQWTTQSEQENLGWNVYRAPSLDLGQGYLLTPDMIEGAGSVSEPTDYVFNDPMGIEGGHIYGYWIESISYSGESELFGPVSLTVPYGIESFGTPIIPEMYGLKQNHPNPFNPNTKISFSVENTCECEITIFDIKGRKLVTLFDDIAYAEEDNYVNWNGEDRQGNKVTSGIYYYRLLTPEKTEMRKMLLFK